MPETSPPPRDPRTGSEYADHLRDVLDHVSERERAAASPTTPKQPPLLTRPPSLIALGLAFACVVAWDVHAMRRPAPPPPPEVEQAGADMSVLAARQAVEEFRAEHGRLPSSLEEAGVSEGLAGYRVTADGYELDASVGSQRTEYKSADGPPPFVQQLILEAHPPGAPR